MLELIFSFSEHLIPHLNCTHLELIQLVTYFDLYFVDEHRAGKQSIDEGVNRSYCSLTDSRGEDDRDGHSSAQAYHIFNSQRYDGFFSSGQYANDHCRQLSAHQRLHGAGQQHSSCSSAQRAETAQTTENVLAYYGESQTSGDNEPYSGAANSLPSTSTLSKGTLFRGRQQQASVIDRGLPRDGHFDFEQQHSSRARECNADGSGSLGELGPGGHRSDGGPTSGYEAGESFPHPQPLLASPPHSRRATPSHEHHQQRLQHLDAHDYFGGQQQQHLTDYASSAQGHNFNHPHYHLSSE